LFLPTRLFVSLNSRRKGLPGPVWRVIKKKQLDKTCPGLSTFAGLVNIVDQNGKTDNIVDKTAKVDNTVKKNGKS